MTPKEHISGSIASAKLLCKQFSKEDVIARKHQIANSPTRTKSSGSKLSANLTPKIGQYRHRRVKTSVRLSFGYYSID